MHTLLSAAGRAFLRVFAVSLIALAPGIFASPTLHSAVLVGVAALMASFGAGLRVLQQYVPALSFSKWLGPVVGKYADAAAQAFVGYILVAFPDLLKFPDQGNWKVLFGALGTAVLAGLARAVQALGTLGESPAPTSGLAVPPGPPKEA